MCRDWLLAVPGYPGKSLLHNKVRDAAVCFLRGERPTEVFVQIRWEALELLQFVVCLRFVSGWMVHCVLHGRTRYTDDSLQVAPCGAMIVFVPGSQDLTVDGCQREGRIIQVQLIADVAHCGRRDRGCVDRYAV